MSDGAPGPDWRLASDGKWYPPASRHAAPVPPPPPPALGRSPGTGQLSMSRGLTSATAIALLSSALLCVIAAWLRVREASRFQRWRSSGFDDAEASRALSSAESQSFAAYVMVFWFCLVVFVLMVVWLYRARVTVDRFGATQLRWSPGWAVGGWFIPVANAVIPKRIMNEIERVSSPDGGSYPVLERWRTVKLRADGWIWWLCLLAGTFIILISFSTAEGGYPTSASFDADGHRRGLYLYAVGLLLVAVSGVAGAITIRRLGRELNRSLDTR